MPSEIIVPSFQPKEGSKVELLGFGNVEWKNQDNGVKIVIPDSVQKNPPSKYAWALKINETIKQ